MTVWNRNKDKCKPLQEKGAKVCFCCIEYCLNQHAYHLSSLQCVCVALARYLHVFPVQVADSAKAVAEQCDITVAMLADPEAAEAVATGPDGIAAGMSSGEPARQSLLIL